jgi:sugar phosphate isomerase/epimerase
VKRSIRELCRLGIVHFMLHKETVPGEGDFSSLLNLLESPDFDAVECTWIHDAQTRSAVAGSRRRNRKALAFAAQPVLLTRGYDLNAPDEDLRVAAVRAMQALVPQAYELEASGFAVVSGPPGDPADRRNAMDRLVRSLMEIAGTLAEQGSIPLVLQPFDQLTYGKNRLIGPSRDAADIAREIRRSHPSFGLLIDLSHLPLQGETPREAWDAAGEYIVHAHMGNCVMDHPDHPMYGDTHPPLCDPAGVNGVDELAEYLRVLYRAGFLDAAVRPFLSFEVATYGEWTVDALIRQSLKTLEEAWAAV